MSVAQWRSMGRSASAYTQCKLPYAMLCYCNVVQGKECGVVYCMG